MSEERPEHSWWCPECERTMRYVVHAIGDGPTHDCVPIEPPAVALRLEAAERRVEDMLDLLQWVYSETTDRNIRDRLRSALSTTEEPKEKPCPDCGGTGGFGMRRMLVNRKPCPTCKGTGKR